MPATGTSRPAPTNAVLRQVAVAAMAAPTRRHDPQRQTWQSPQRRHDPHRQTWHSLQRRNDPHRQTWQSLQRRNDPRRQARQSSQRRHDPRRLAWRASAARAEPIHKSSEPVPAEAPRPDTCLVAAGMPATGTSRPAPTNAVLRHVAVAAMAAPTRRHDPHRQTWQSLQRRHDPHRQTWQSPQRRHDPQRQTWRASAARAEPIHKSSEPVPAEAPRPDTCLVGAGMPATGTSRPAPTNAVLRHGAVAAMAAPTRRHDPQRQTGQLLLGGTIRSARQGSSH